MGERRWRASILADKETIPAVVREGLTDADHLRLALVENLQRRDLDPIEEAEGYAQLNRVVGLRQAEIAAAVNRSQPAVANAMRLLELPEDVQDRIRRRELSVSHGIALARYKNFPAVVLALAGLAIEHNWTSHHLEGSALRQHAYAFQNKGLIREVGHGTRFDIAANCERCPFGAYRKGEYGAGLCLKPEHYRELNDAAEAEQRAALEAKVAEARAAGGEDGVLKLADLEWEQYQRVGSGGDPAGCSDDCPCRAVALDRAGNPTPICTDPKRFRSLQAAETKAKRADKREQHKAEVARLEAHMDALDELGDRELALICAAALSTLSKPTAGKAAAEHVGIAALLEGFGFARWQLRASGMDELLSLARGDVLRLTVEALVRNDLANLYEGYGGDAKQAVWYLGSPAENLHTSADVSSDASIVTFAICAECGDTLTIADAIRYGDEWLCVECYEVPAVESDDPLGTLDAASLATDSPQATAIPAEGWDEAKAELREWKAKPWAAEDEDVAE